MKRANGLMKLCLMRNLIQIKPLNTCVQFLVVLGMLCLSNSEMHAKNFDNLFGDELISEIHLDWDFSEADASIVETENFITCVGSAQLSLSETGSSTLTPGMFLLGVAPPFTNYIVDIVGPLTDVVTCDEIGQNLMVKVTDTVANNSCWSSLIVEDKLAPIIICNPDTLPCGTDINTIDYESLIDSLSDNCDDDIDLWFNQDFVDFDCDPMFAGKVVRTYHAIDNFNNESVCTLEVYLQKASIDSVVFPVNDTMYCPYGSTEPEFTGEPTLFGEPLNHFCEIMAFHNDLVIPTCGCTFKIRRTWTVMDWCTLESVEMDQFIVIQDSIGPVVTCPSDEMLGTDSDICGATFMIPEPTITNACGCDEDYNVVVTFDPFMAPASPGDIVTLDTGTTVLTYTVTDACFKQSTCEMSVTVTDDDSPQLNCSPLTVFLDNMGFAEICADDLQFIYDDNCAVVDTQIRRMPDFCNDPANEIFGECVTFCCDDLQESVMLAVQVSDQAGNMNQCMVPITVMFNLPPDAITCPNDTILAAGPNCERIVVLEDPVIVSGCPLTFVSERSDGLALTAPYPKGVTTVTYSVPGPNGPLVECSTTVTVNDSTPPVITCLPDTTAGTNLGNCTATLNLAQPTATDNCDVTITQSRSDNRAMGEPFEKGTTVITYTATDCGGFERTCQREITVVDDDPPTITCPSNVVIGTDPGVCFASAASVNLADPSFNDNCPDEIITFRRSDGLTLMDNYLKGITTVTFIITDCGGNVDSCSLTVEVQDLEFPTITCAANIDAFTAPNQCSAIVPIPPATINDNCPDETVVVTRSDNADLDDPFMIGMTTVTYIVTDCGNNMDTCELIVTVTDTMNPMIICPNDTIVNGDANCQALVTLDDPMVNDNCPMVGFTAERS
ncbi:MAG: HYR domain-containing protein, partial [Bacteroidota bacterium]